MKDFGIRGHAENAFGGSMVRWVWRWLAISLLFVAACSTDTHRSEKSTQVVQGLTGVGNLSVSLPIGVGLTEAALSSSGYVRIADRSKVASSTASGFVASTGSGETNIGTDTRVKHVTSVGKVVLRERARIDGDVTTSAMIETQNGVVVTGTRSEHVMLLPPTVITRPFEFMGGTNINREPDAPFASLSPGNYGNVTIKSRSGLVLAPGTYFFESVSIDFQAKLRLTSTSEPTIILIRSGLDFKGDFEYGGDAADVFFGIFGSGTVSLERALHGTVVAPHATLRFAPAHRTFSGTFFAKSIEIEPDLTIDFVPFEHWDLIFPAVPIVECITLFDETHGTAVFGYENQLASAITIPLGSSNQLDPDLGFAPPDTFLPGRHHAALLAPFPGTQVTWTLGGTSVTADTSTRRCDLADYPPDQPAGIVLEGSSRPDPAALAGIVPDNFQGVRTESAPLPWGPSSPGDPALTGASSGSTGTIQQALGAVDPFRVVITFMQIGDDAACWAGDPTVRVNFSGSSSNFNRTLTTDCGGVSACATDYFYDEAIAANHILPTDPEVGVRIRLFDFDCCGCGSILDQDEEVIDVSFTVNNANGAIVSGHAGDCAGGDGWELCWRVEPNGRPRVCTSWNGEYVDSGEGEDFLPSGVAQVLPASFARARFTLANSDFGPIDPWEGVLDVDGCIPIDETPPAAAWRIGPATALTARMDLTTQHCFDPSGGGCAPGPAGEPRGASFVTRRAITAPGPTFGSLLGPDTTCALLTTDETLVDPSCSVKKASGGAFAAWQDELPPASISVASETATGSSARVAGVVSEILRREVTTEGDMGIELGLIANRGGGSEVTFAVDKTCALLEGTTVVERDSCRDGLTLNLRHDMLCTEEPFSACFANLDLGYFTPCVVGEDANCLPGDSYWKYVITHEFGHFIQGSITGTFFPDYRFEVTPGAFFEDLPGAPAVCGCSHVTSSNAWHCLQSLEKPNAAQIEGFGQFYASKVWNDETQADCSFLYYKEHQFPAPTPGAPLPEPAPPPVAFSCVDPIRFRNTHCIGSPSFSGLAVTEMGTELDWMGFYYAVNTQGDSLTLTEIADVYRTACSATTSPLGFCSGGGAITWEQLSAVGTVPSMSLRVAVESMFDTPAEAAKRNHFTQMGDEYGVSRDTDPLP